MGAGEAVAVALVLVVVAGVTAGFWLNLLLWLPLLGLKWMHLDSFVVVQSLAMFSATAAVLVVGIYVLGLPILAAAVAGLLVGATTFARPSAAY